MLELKVTISEQYDEKTGEFLEEVGIVKLEHSLLSLSKWESKYEKPFFTDREEKTQEEILDYLCMMVVENDVPGDLLSKLTNDHVVELQNYIDKKATATWINEPEKKTSKRREVVTSELIYYWMFSYSIPKECETWHLNRLLTLIRVFGAKNEKPKKMSKGEIMSRNRALNEQRKAKLKTKG